MRITNRRILYVLGALLLGIITVVVCYAIEKYSKMAFDSRIKFNYESGFFDAPIEVELSVGSNYYITYTLDGTAPNAFSSRYTGPILITDATEKDNVWSVMESTSLRYFEEGHYNVPDFQVDKCAVLRAAAFDYFGDQVSSDIREYFIGFDDRKGYKDMYNLCVVSDPENLFDVEYGIYNVGPYYNSKIESGKVYVMYTEGEGWDKEGGENWTWSGRESERPATIEIFEPSGKLVMREECGVRIRGGESRYNTQKPLGFYAREEYSGNEEFKLNFLKTRGEENEGYKNFLIHSSGDDFNVKLTDYVIYSALSKGNLTFDVSPIIPCNLFIDGEYWGPMYLMKDINCDTIAADYDLGSENIVLIKSGDVKISKNLESVGDYELNQWNELQNFIRYSDMSDKENYDYVCSKIDMDNFAEYAAAEIYVANADWHPDNNTAFWKTIRPDGQNMYSDGKWRCSLFDVNWAFQSWDTLEAETYTYIGWDMCYMVQALCKNDEFKQLYLERISEMEQLFTPDVVSEIIDEWSNVMEEPIRCHFKRFGINLNSEEEIEAAKRHIMEFCSNRPESIKKVNDWLFE